MSALRSLTLVSMSAALFLALPACGIFSSDSNSDSETPSEMDGDDEDAESAPIFLDFSVNTTTATDLDNLIFTALLTDPDGIDDLIGGSLKSPSGASYGSFATSSAEGSYEIVLTWSALHTVSPITLEGDSSSREFTAEFFDASGNTVSRSVTVDLMCDGGVEEGTCEGGGMCVSLRDNAHCMACDNDCDDTSGINFGPGRVTGRPECVPAADGCVANVVVQSAPGRTCDVICGEWDCAGASYGGLSISCGAESSADVLHCECEK